MQIERFVMHANRQIDQIQRRVVKGEKIPHAEKVFSLFEEHTEWVSKGKAGVPVELGLRVNIMEDQHGYILHHQVMEKQTDDKVAVSIVRETMARFPEFRAVVLIKAITRPRIRRICVNCWRVWFCRKRVSAIKQSRKEKVLQSFRL